MDKWTEAQTYEAKWHAKIGANTFNEERKQFVYAKKMGIEIYPTPETPFNIKNYGKVLDIGGGEVSMLLKVEKPEGCAVIDPCDYPSWVVDRYTSKGIMFMNYKAEDIEVPKKKYDEYDEVWIYNCLQHVENPEVICHKALQTGKLVRVFEWIDLPICEGHIHTLTEKGLNKWLGGFGKVGRVDEDGCNGQYYAGIFLGLN